MKQIYVGFCSFFSLNLRQSFCTKAEPRTDNSDNNQHSPNENLRLGNSEEGIRTVVGILTEPISE